jgi:hypothetical protein
MYSISASSSSSYLHFSCYQPIIAMRIELKAHAWRRAGPHLRAMSTHQVKRKPIGSAHTVTFKMMPGMSIF